MDAGWDVEDERDAKRIVAVMGNAGINKIDYFIASHFHTDHVNGLPALARRVPIGQYIDHGNSVEQDKPSGLKSWKAYLAAAKDKRRTIVPGDKLELAGLDFTFVTSNRAVLGQALADSGPNTYCDNTSPGENLTGENPSSVGYLLSLGKFNFLNLGDLTINIQHKLACPSNLIGVIDLYQVPHHGNGIAPQLSWAIAPTVAVLNNGPHKGGSPEGYEVISSVPDIKAIWQVHRALDTDDDHNTSAQMTANLTEEDDAGYWIKATVQADGGSYVIENGRNGYSETYLAK
jgi:beta-lactamase superfamily II metal-dependent hydrolase